MERGDLSADADRLVDCMAVPSQDQALQQVVMLKKELAEMRANQALAEDKIIASKTSLDREVGKARGMITPMNTEADMERSAHRETMDTLERSEQTVSLLLVLSEVYQIQALQGKARGRGECSVTSFYRFQALQRKAKGRLNVPSQV